jgi:glutaredoxin
MWTIYSRPHCSYCELAKILMTERGIKFEERGLIEEQDREWFKGQGYKTVPQIFDDADNHIGGYEELRKYFNNLSN